MPRLMIIALSIFIYVGCEAGTTQPAEEPDAATTKTTEDTVVASDTAITSSADTVPVKTDECTAATAEDDCDDGVACTQDRCYGGSCIHVANNLPCDDGDPCTYDSCDPDQITNGGCSNKPRGCGDNDICTLDVCIPGVGCDNSQLNPDACAAAMDECHGAICVPGQGCQLVPVSCDDGDITTVDACVTGIGCTHTVVECGSGSYGDCEPSSPCKVAQCVAGKCQETAKDCDDDIACTDDSCDTNGVCQHVANAGNCPNDTLTCTVAMCDVKYGCVQSWVQCDDDNICTADSCEEGAGCQFNLIDGCCMTSDQCDDGNACTTDICTPLNRCEHTPLNPDDGIACTEDTCVPNGTSSYFSHLPQDGICAEGFHCKQEVGCVECTSYSHCDDEDPCTNDWCDFQTSSCRHDPRDCGDTQQCNPETGACEDTTDGCQYDWQCDDGDPCTDDLCRESGECGHIAVDVCINCDPEAEISECPNTLTCDGGRKQVQYTGNCWSWGVCEYQTQVCTDNSCTTRSCVEGSGCIGQPKCDDEDPCTSDVCDWDTGACSNTPIQGCVQ